MARLECGTVGRIMRTVSAVVSAAVLRAERGRPAPGEERANDLGTEAGDANGGAQHHTRAIDVPTAYYD